MFKAFSGAFSLLLTILVLKMVLPDIANLVIDIIYKSLLLVSKGIDITASQANF